MMNDRVIDPRIDGPICEWSDLIQRVRTYAHAMGQECDVYHGLDGRPAGVCRIFLRNCCTFDVMANIRHARMVEAFRNTAATSVDRGAYYREALRIWRTAPAPADKFSEVAIREAAACDGVSLDEEGA